jgi:cytidine deaminase
MEEVSGEIIERLLDHAKASASRAYCKYSGFPVGAAVVDEEGRIFEGANIENLSFGLTNCAERTAIFSAIASGSKEITAVAIYTPTPTLTYPCGACRQVIFEHSRDAIVAVCCDHGNVEQKRISELLPNAFSGIDVGSISAVASQVRSRLATNSKKRICIDIDNVVARTDEILRNVIKQATAGRVDLSYEHISVFNYWQCNDANGNGITRDEWRVIHDQFSTREILLSIPVVQDSLPSLERIGESYAIHFATSRLPAARSATIEWLDANGFPPHDLHFLKHGEKHVTLGGFDVSVEDDPAQVSAFDSAGFGLNIVMNHPWNTALQESGTIRRAHSWAEIERMLRLQ